MPTSILATKLYIPSSRAKVVIRPRLIEQLNKGLSSGRKLTLISAPASFGKTTLVSEWVAGCGRPTAWLSLDEGDSDPIRFLIYLVSALQTVAPNVGEGVLVVMHTAGREEEIGKIYHRPWFVQAPLVIAVCAISSQACVREGDRFNARLIDAAIVADHLILAATNLGLGTCWIAAFNLDAARSVLQLPDEAEPVIFTPLGYPADQPGPKIRKPLTDLVRYEHW